MKLGNDVVTGVRQRLARTQHGRRGRAGDPAWDERMRMGCCCQIANMAEATKLYDTIVAWWDAIEVLTVTGVTTARVEANSTGIKSIRRTGRGFRNPENCRTHILLTSAARTAA